MREHATDGHRRVGSWSQVSIAEAQVIGVVCAWQVGCGYLSLVGFLRINFIEIIPHITVCISIRFQRTDLQMGRLVTQYHIWNILNGIT